MGFGDEGIVALSGAHTLGRAFKVKVVGVSVGSGLLLFAVRNERWYGGIGLHGAAAWRRRGPSISALEGV